MKKKSLFFIALCIVCLTSCPISRPVKYDIRIKNASAKDVVVHINFVKNETVTDETDVMVKKGGEYIFTNMYESYVSLKEPCRVTMMRHKRDLYEITDIKPVKYTVYNRSTKNAVLKDKYGLFDTVSLSAQSNEAAGSGLKPNKVEIDVYPYNGQIYPEVTSRQGGFPLHVNWYPKSKTIIISYPLG